VPRVTPKRVVLAIVALLAFLMLLVAIYNSGEMETETGEGPVLTTP